ncbi:FGGY family carbohydrate kinase [uncultured Ilyobacter sp.]|uniref:FGGY-family carbohydrate kinase n=1 Tax=uncultured Ilyobacter sp. TaxID=544433 RepID=UPI0029F458A3|nr:FGGY family carbohydrate kinase [uncultured Ilyobacter sp.]
MKDKFIIGIDGGTQSSKVVIFNTKGDIICQATEKLKPLHMPSLGVAEHPDEDLWDSLAIASRKALAKFPFDKKDIIGVGVCTIRCCGVVLKKDGALAQPAMNWMDQRLGRKYEHTNKEVGYVTTTTGYTSYRLTGNFYDTSANLQGPWWPIDKVKWQWFEDEEKFNQFGIPKEMLFELKNPGEVVGHITEKASEDTHIPLGLPVIITANDKAVEALGAGLKDKNVGLVSLGTYICTMVCGEEMKIGNEHSWSNMANIPYEYIYESKGIRRGMSTVSWVKDLAGSGLVEEAKEKGISPEELLNKEAEKISPGCYGLMTVLEWLGKPFEPFKRGIMIGFEGRHERAAMYRSILEGIAMTSKNRLFPAVEELDIDLEKVIISGGGSNSDLFMQIFADVFGIKTVRNVVNGSAGLGSAISVAVGLGIYEDYNEATENMVKIRDTFYPNMENHEFYDKLNEHVYKDITVYTDKILQKSYEIFDEYNKF